MHTTTQMARTLQTAQLRRQAEVRSALTHIGGQLVEPAVDPRRLGVLGEQYAAAWLECHGWRILERNWRTRYGELDIIAFDVAHTVVFVEVKTRRGEAYGPPQEAVGPRKRLNLRRAAVLWLESPGHRVRHSGIRFDVLAISLRGRVPHVQCITGAF